MFPSSTSVSFVSDKNTTMHVHNAYFHGKWQKLKLKTKNTHTTKRVAMKLVYIANVKRIHTGDLDLIHANLIANCIFLH